MKTHVQEIKVTSRWRQFTHCFTLACTALMAMAAIISCSSQGANIVRWFDDMIHMPGFVREFVTSQREAIMKVDSDSIVRDNSIRDAVVFGNSNIIVQIIRLRESNDCDHTIIRAGQAVLKANQQAVIHTLDTFITNHPPILWQQQYGTLPILKPTN